MEELTTGFGLIEGPVWDEVRGLIFSDVVNGGVWALSTAGIRESQILDHPELSGPVFGGITGCYDVDSTGPGRRRTQLQ